MNANLPVPLLRVDGDAIAANDRRAFLRAVSVLAVATVRGGADPMALLKAAWPDDRTAVTVLRAVSNPTTTANFPVANVIGLFRSIAPKSAALELFNLGRVIDLTGVNTVAIPGAGAPVNAPFVAEGAPGPVVVAPLAGFVLGPARKMLIMAGVTRELDQASPQGAVNIVAAVLGAAIANSLDATVFGTAAATAAAPAGLFHGVAPVAASSAASVFDAIVDDVGSLAGAIGDANIDTNELVYVGGPKQAVALKLYAGDRFDYPILASNALKGCLAAFAAPAIAAAYADLPQVETSLESTLQYSDTPAAGGPLAGGPTLSAFQQELINIKLRGRAAWAVQPGGAQIIQNVTW